MKFVEQDCVEAKFFTVCLGPSDTARNSAPRVKQSARAGTSLTRGEGILMKHMRNRVVVALAILGSASALAISGLNSANATYGNTRPCVSMREYVVLDDRNFDEWLSPTQVHNIFDTYGTQVDTHTWGDTGQYRDVLRSYRKCSQWGNGGTNVGVLFTNSYWYDGDTSKVLVVDDYVSRTPSRLAWWNAARMAARGDDNPTKAQRDRALAGKE